MGPLNRDSEWLPTVRGDETRGHLKRQEFEVPYTPINSSKINPPVPFLLFGPEYGVVHTKLSEHPKNFDDSIYMGIPGSDRFRVIRRFKCSYQYVFRNIKDWTGRPRLIGLQSVYADPRPDDITDHGIITVYHGYEPIVNARKHDRSYELDLTKAEVFTKFTIRACDGLFWGLHAATNLNRNAVACGLWQKLPAETGCEERTLTPLEGYHIVGLYGDANGIFHWSRQGIRGLGLVTMPDRD